MAVAQPDEPSAESPGAETITELFNALESLLLTYALRLVRDLNTAEDIVQEAFLRLQAEFQNVKAPRRWLYRTVHNLALNHQRRLGKVVSMDHPIADGIEIPDPQPLPDEQIARLEGIGLVRLTLATLDERSRELIRLKFTENLSYKEISQRTGLTVSNVGYLLHHALKAVAAELSRGGGMP